MRPVAGEPVDIYLDVDGVLNVLSPDARGWPEYAETRAAGWSIRYAPAMIERLIEVTAPEHVRVWWLTTWLDAAREHLAPALGLPDWPVLGHDAFQPEPVGEWWKHRVIREHWTGGRAVWCDDDLTFDAAAHRWVAESGSILGVCPLSDHGLGVAHLDAIERWVAAAHQEVT